MKVWLLATSKNDGHCSYNELKYRKILAQGWPELGDLSALLPVYDEDKFVKLINLSVDYVYEGFDDPRNPGRILLNLLNFSEGDLVVCAEGREAIGMAKVGRNPTYNFNSGNGLYEYAQTISPIAEWRDWNTDILGVPPSTGTMGPKGITNAKTHTQAFIEAWEKLNNQ